MNDPKLQLAMARLLPEKITASVSWPGLYFWKDGAPILETEWREVMAMVEAKLNPQQINPESKEWAQYVMQLSTVTGFGSNIAATFNQRATAMCRTLRIEI